MCENGLVVEALRFPSRSSCSFRRTRDQHLSQDPENTPLVEQRSPGSDRGCKSPRDGLWGVHRLDQADPVVDVPTPPVGDGGQLSKERRESVCVGPAEHVPRRLLDGCCGDGHADGRWGDQDCDGPVAIERSSLDDANRDEQGRLGIVSPERAGLSELGRYYRPDLTGEILV